jgi:uncharacterized protein (TIGR03437 family)
LSLITHHCLSQVITTIAGVTGMLRGAGGPAVNAHLGLLIGIARDSAGNIYAADASNNVIVKITPAGILTVVAGNRLDGFSGDGGPATAASISLMPYPGIPSTVGLVADSSGALYFSDSWNNRVRRVAPDGTITTVAGSGSRSFSGDGGPATAAGLDSPTGLARDAAGNLYVSDGDDRIRKVSPSGIITTIAGTGTGGFSGDGGPATSARLRDPQGLAVDSSGRLYVADRGNQRIRRISADGIITTIAGGGIADSGPATAVFLALPLGVSVDAALNLYIADGYNNRICKVSPSGTLVTIANVSQTGGFAGDGWPAAAALLNEPAGVLADNAGNIFIADTENWRIRKITPDGNIATIAGNGGYHFFGDGGPPSAAELNKPSALAFDGNGNLYIADVENYRIRRIDTRGTITTIAGTGVKDYTVAGDGGPATAANISPVEGIVADRLGNVYFSQSGAIRRVSPGGIITTVAGTGARAFGGDGGPATLAQLDVPDGLALDAAGNLYIADYNNNRVRKVDTGGIIRTVAGGGSSLGDGGPATSAMLDRPVAVAVDGSNNLYISDTRARRVRKVTPTGTISTYAGGGTSLLEGIPATQAMISGLGDLALDAAGNLYLADSFDHRVRKVTPGGIIGTVAGNGSAGFSGDGGPAVAASLDHPEGIALDAAGNLFIADRENDRIRAVLAAPPPFTAGPASLSFTAATGAPMVPAQSITVSSLYSGVNWYAEASTESGGGWLSISPAGGATPGSVSVNVSVAGMVPGVYRGIVTVRAPLATPPSVRVSVELTVTQALAPRLVVDPLSLNLESTVGGSSPSRTVRISNGGGGTLSWTARATTVSGGNWLAVSAAGGTASAAAPSSLQASTNVTGLAAGVYSGSVELASPGTQERTTVAVSLILSQTSAAILVSQTGLVFTGVQGAGTAPPQSFGVVNIGAGAMNWSARAEALSGGNWLAVSPASGRSDADSLQIPLVDVSVNLLSLRAGQYSGLIRVEAPGAINSPQFVTVELNVLPPGSNPGVQVRPTGLIFAARAGASSPGSQNVRLGAATPGRLEARSGVMTFDGGAWLRSIPQNVVVEPADPQTITVQPALGSLPPGAYRAALTLLFSDGSPAQTVNILFLVVGGAGAAVAWFDGPSEAGAAAAAACVPGRLHAVHRSLAGNFVASVGSPSPIEVQVVDDCGSAVANATVVASFTNGDPSLSLASLRNGSYVATWRPQNAAAQVTATVRASLPPLASAELPAQGLVRDNPSAPALALGGIVNGASFAPNGALAPGSIVSVFGANLASSPAGAASLPLPKTLAGASLQVGGYDVPLFYSSGGQINAQLPFELPLNTRPQLIVKGADFVTVPETITVAAARPGIFTTSQDGKGQGVIMDVNNRLVDASNPAKAGDVVVVYCTGLGATNPAVRSGEAAPTSPLAKVSTPVSVTIGGQAAAVQYAGLTPGFVGLYQVNVQIPSGVTRGSSVPLVISQDGVPSNTVTLAVN